MCAFYRPEAHRRQAALEPHQAALLFIDVQNYNCSKRGAIFQSLSPQEQAVGGGVARPAADARAADVQAPHRHTRTR